MTSNTEKSQRRTARIDQCRICGDTAYYSYFGVLSCQTCKMFFKRYGNMKKVCRDASKQNHIRTLVLIYLESVRLF